MKKKILILAIFAIMLCGCEKTIPKLENGNEAVVTFSNDDMISVDALYDKLKKTSGTSMLIDMIDTKIFENKYKDKKEDAEKQADSSIESIKLYYKDENGNYDESALLNALNQYYGFTSLDEYREAVILNYYRNQAIKDYTKEQVSDSEIKKYYKNEIVGDREVSHILITSEVKDDMSDEDKTKAEEDALAKAKEVITKLKKGEKFEDLAKTYSSDEDTKEKGGSLGYINKGDYGSDEFDTEVYSLEVGSYSKTPVKTSLGYEVVYVTNEKEKKSLDDVKDSIVETLSEEKLNNDATMQVLALKELRKSYGVDIVDDEINSRYNTYMNNLYDQALQNNEN